MGEVALYRTTSTSNCEWSDSQNPRDVQGYLAHEKHPPRRTIQQDHASGPMKVLEGGGGFL